MLCAYRRHCVSMKPQCMEWTPVDTQGTPSSNRMVCVCTCGVVCFCVNSSSFSDNAQRHKTIVPLLVFVWGSGETGNEIMLRALAVCARGLSKSRPGAGGEYQSLISQPCLVYGNEEQFIQCNVLKLGGISGYTGRCHLSLHLFTPHLIQNVPLVLQRLIVKRLIPKYWPTVYRTRLPFSSYLTCLPTYFTSS